MPQDPIEVAVGPQPPPVSEEAAAAARELALRVVDQPVEVALQGAGVAIEPASCARPCASRPTRPTCR